MWHVCDDGYIGSIGHLRLFFFFPLKQKEERNGRRKNFQAGPFRRVNICCSLNAIQTAARAIALQPWKNIELFTSLWPTDLDSSSFQNVAIATRLSSFAHSPSVSIIQQKPKNESKTKQKSRRSHNRFNFVISFPVFYFLFFFQDLFQSYPLSVLRNSTSRCRA